MRLSAVLQRNWQSLIKPEKLLVEPGSDPSRVGTVIAEPLERGFGITLGLVMSLFFGVTDGWLWWRCRREYAVNPSPIVATQTRMNATACITAVGVAGTLAITLLTQASWLHL